MSVSMKLFAKTLTKTISRIQDLYIHLQKESKSKPIVDLAVNLNVKKDFYITKVI